MPEKSSPPKPTYEELERELAVCRKDIAALKNQRDFLNTLLETIPSPVFFKNADGIYTGCNRAFEEFIGKQRDEIIGGTVYDMGPSEIVEKYQEKDQEILQTSHTQKYQWKIRSGDGSLRDVIFDKAPLFDENGRISGLIGIISDITQRIEAERALRESEERYHALADATFEAVFISENGVCIDANDTAAEMFGYSHDEMIGKFGTDFIAPESMDIAKLNMLSGYGKPYEAVGLRKDGTTFAVEIRGKMAEYKGRTVRITVVHDIDDYTRAAAALKESEKNLHYLSSSLMAAQERERQWIAYTMHDEMAQDLVVLTIELKLMDDVLRDDQEPLKETCRRVKKHVVKIIENIRNISHELSPVLIEDLGLSTAIRLLVEDFTQQTNMIVNLEMENIDKLFPPKTEIIVYRIFQEAFTNIRKHSQATHVRVVLRKRPNDVYVSVEDNGKGFPMKETSAGDGPKKKLGFIAMEERARMLGTIIKRYSLIGQGTRIVFSIPTEET
jgi:PAS domain S-box-containing protein